MAYSTFNNASVNGHTTESAEILPNKSGHLNDPSQPTITSTTSSQSTATSM